MSWSAGMASPCGGGEGASEQDLKAMIDQGNALLAEASALAASA
jgi:hypothetical protein